MLELAILPAETTDTRTLEEAVADRVNRLTVQDVKAYVLSKLPGEYVGTIQDPNECLIANVLKHFHPGLHFGVSEWMSIGQSGIFVEIYTVLYQHHVATVMIHDPELRSLLVRFDEMHPISPQVRRWEVEHLFASTP